MEDDVVVWGRRFNDGVPFWTFYSIWERGVVQPGTDPNPVLNPDDDSGYQTEVIPHLSVCPSPATAARRAADKIASLPTGDDWEWGGGIVAANNEFRISGERLTTQGEAGTGAVMVLSTDFPNLRGSIHNHPRNRPFADADLDRYPSNADWAAIEELPKAARAVNQTVDLSNFVLYVMWHDGTVRGFPYALRSTYPTDAQAAERRQGVNLPPAFGPASGCRN